MLTNDKVFARPGRVIGPFWGVMIAYIYTILVNKTIGMGFAGGHVMKVR